MRDDPLTTTDDRTEPTSPRPLNPIAAITLVLVFPHRTFERLRERPRWILPLAFVAAASIVSAVFATRGGHMDEFVSSIAFRSGASPGNVEAGFVASAFLMAIIGVPIMVLLEALFFKAAGSLFGGRSPFKVVFSAVAHASVPVGIGALAFVALLPLTGSVEVGANLSFLIEPASRPYLWSVARQVDLFAIWFFVLLGIAAAPILQLPRLRARAAALAFALFHIAVMSTWGWGSAGQYGDPYESWTARSTDEGVLHFGDATPPTMLGEVESALARATGRAEVLTGRPLERIDCYIYPSVAEKRRVTDNDALAHGVPWANAVHLAWAPGSELALTREVAKLAGAREAGNVYNPFTRDGLGILAGGEWGGEPVRAVAADLAAEGGLPSLDELIEPARYARLDPGAAQIAAGSFAAFFLEERGISEYRAFLDEAASAPHAVDRLLADAFLDSLSGVERRWQDFLGARDRASDPGPVSPEGNPGPEPGYD